MEIEKAGQRAASLTRQLLAFSRQQVLEPIVLQLNRVVSDMEKMFRRIVGEDIDLVIGLEPNLEPIRADHGQLEQVLANLVINAHDAMPTGGTLTIGTANTRLSERTVKSRQLELQPGTYVTLRVSDTGEGIPEEIRSNVFEPFFTNKAEGQGTGLGLSTVYGIVRQSQGDLCLESQVGQGTSFTVYLPAVEDTVETALVHCPISSRC